MFHFITRCKHDFILVANIGGDMQASAWQCSKCKKQKVEVHGILSKPDFEYIVRLRKEGF